MPPQVAHPVPPSLPLTLIVATTPVRVASTTPASALSNQVTQDPNGSYTGVTRLGIGLKGTLPWPRIKADMSFFARVTSRPPTPGTTNAIIMGRKTYDSVPKHLRPLAKRINVVITRDQSGSVREGVLRELEVRRAKMAAKTEAAEEEMKKQEQGSKEMKAIGESLGDASNETHASSAEPITDAIVTSSLDAALAELDSVYGATGQLGRIFVIGGAEIYGASLRMHNLEGSAELQRRPIRVVMTNVVRKVKGAGEGPETAGSFECDTFFPLDGMTEQNGWRRANAQEVSEWVGEEVSEEWKREGEVEIQMVGFEQVN